MYDVHVLRTEAQYIHTRMTNKSTQETFCVTFVYAYNLAAERVELWEQLKQLALVTHEPWVVMGDCYCVLTDQDRIGGNPVTVHEVLDFQDCIECCEWEPMRWTGWQREVHGNSMYRIIQKRKFLKAEKT